MSICSCPIPAMNLSCDGCPGQKTEHQIGLLKQMIIPDRNPDLALFLSYLEKFLDLKREEIQERRENWQEVK